MDAGRGAHRLAADRPRHDRAHTQVRRLRLLPELTRIRGLRPRPSGPRRDLRGEGVHSRGARRRHAGGRHGAGELQDALGPSRDPAFRYGSQHGIVRHTQVPDRRRGRHRRRGHHGDRAAGRIPGVARALRRQAALHGQGEPPPQRHAERPGVRQLRQEVRHPRPSQQVAVRQSGGVEGIRRGPRLRVPVHRCGVPRPVHHDTQDREGRGVREDTQGSAGAVRLRGGGPRG